MPPYSARVHTISLDSISSRLSYTDMVEQFSERRGGKQIFFLGQALSNAFA